MNLFADSGQFGISVDVPDVDIAFSVTGGEDTWVSWTPLGIVDIFLCTLKGHNRFLTILRSPELHSPVHGTREEELRHVTMLLRLTDAWMHINTSDWSIVVLILGNNVGWTISGSIRCTYRFAIRVNILLTWFVPNVAPIDAEVFGAHVEYLLLTFREV